LHQRVLSDWLIAERTLAIDAVHGALDVVIVGVMPPLIAVISSFCSGMRVSRLRFSLRLVFFMVGLLCVRGWLAKRCEMARSYVLAFGESGVVKVGSEVLLVGFFMACS
jgi:hypothetical protein